MRGLVEPTNAKGKPWDRATKLTTCNAGDDSSKGYCQLDETIDVTPGTRIELEGPTQLPFDLRGRIKSATLTVQPVPTWFDNHRAGFIGLGIEDLEP